jgi:hypothetical protein
MMKTEKEGRELGTMMHQASAGSKPVMPAASEPDKPVRRSSDPSSTTRNNRYPVPSFFEQRFQRAD